MKEGPILFSGPMVRAILEGRKTQTRRVVKAELDHECGHPPRWFDATVDRDHPEAPAGNEWACTHCGYGLGFRCPYGVSGDRLWVRETHQFDPPRDGSWADTQFFGCKGAPLSYIPERFRNPTHCLYRASWLHSEITWRPAIHMPRWASRITLEITEVRVQRLQEISEEDAKAEGAPFAGPRTHEYEDLPTGSYRYGFMTLWDSINGKRPGCAWSDNPWVWALTFKQVSA